jgi:ring-1,2-phenylacetyl-CoA epoxidase subunit PaaE
MLTFHSLRVAGIHPEAEDAVGISLDVPADLRETYRGLPGQHIVVKTEINDEENRRTYSLVSPPGESPLRIVARVHAAGQMSRYFAEQLNEGDELDVLPPNGSFTPRRDTHGKGRYVAFASGCGITPVLSIVRSLLSAEKTNRVVLFYGNTSTGRAMCMEELLGLKDRYLDRLSLHFVMSREPQEVELYNGRIDPAKVREFARTLFSPADVTEYFVCGPGNMIDEVSATLRQLGVEADRIHGEHFTLATTNAATETTPETATVVASGGASSRSAASATPGSAASTPGVSATSGSATTIGASAAYGSATPGAGVSEVRSGAGTPAASSKPALAPDESQVTVLMDGRRRTFTMRMNDEVVLDAAMRAGLELPFSCRAGVCSTCRTKVVRGEVEMAQNYALEDWEVEQGYILACQSCVKTPVLELDYDEK